MKRGRGRVLGVETLESRTAPGSMLVGLPGLFSFFSPFEQDAASRLLDVAGGHPTTSQSTATAKSNRHLPSRLPAAQGATDGLAGLAVRPGGPMASSNTTRDDLPPLSGSAGPAHHELSHRAGSRALANVNLDVRVDVGASVDPASNAASDQIAAAAGNANFARFVQFAARQTVPASPPGGSSGGESAGGSGLGGHRQFAPTNSVSPPAPVSWPPAEYGEPTAPHETSTPPNTTTPPDTTTLSDPTTPPDTLMASANHVQPSSDNSAALLGDMDFDGDLDLDDIQPLVDALVDPSAYADRHGVDPATLGDANGDGNLDLDDVSRLVDLVLGQGSGVEPLGNGDPLEPAGSKDDRDWGYRERGAWNEGQDGAGWQGDYRWQDAGTGRRTASWVTRIEAGSYEIFATWPADPGHAPDAPYQIFDGAALVGTVTRDQRTTPSDGEYDGRMWASLGEYQISSGVPQVRLSDDATGRVAADGILFVPAEPVDEIVTLVEDDQFRVSYERTITVPAQPSTLAITYDQLQFDTTDPEFINDAFEVALLDESGRSLVHTIDTDRDALLNVTEGEAVLVGANTDLDGQTIRVDLTHITPATRATLVARLVNNDADTTTTVRITGVQVEAGSLGTPAGIARRVDAVDRSQAVDFDALLDVTPSLAARYGVTSLNDAANIVSAELALENIGSYAVGTALVVAVDRISDPRVRVRGFDGTTPDGLPMYRMDHVLPGGVLRPGVTSGERTISFFNPGGEPFTYELLVLAQLNREPQITSQPGPEALVGRPYTYDTAATDADNDPLTFSLQIAPGGAAIDPASGLIEWTPTVDDLGSHTLRVLVTDGQGGSDSQTYTLTVRDNVPNRPPVFQSFPVVDANVATPYEYLPAVSDADGDPLTFGLATLPSGMTIDPATGQLDWTPTDRQLGDQNVALTVDDGRGGAATQTFIVRVSPQPGNHPPEIISAPVTDFAVAIPASPAGDVDPDSINMSTGEVRDETVSVLVHNPTPGVLDLIADSIDVTGVTTAASTLAVSGTAVVALRNVGPDAYESSNAGPFEVMVFEDRNSTASYEAGIDNVLGTTSHSNTLAAGESVAVNVVVHGIVQFAGKPLFAFVDSSRLVTESDELNNVAHSGVDSTYVPSSDWLPVVEWDFDAGFSQSYGVVATPAVAPLIDTTGDGLINERDIPAVIVVTSGEVNGGQLNTLRAFRGDTGAPVFAVAHPRGANGDYSSQGHTPAVGDMDGDGIPEIVLANGLTSPIFAFNNDGSLKWESEPVRQSGASNLVLADLDGDGTSEIITGRGVVLNGDGTIRWQTATSPFPWDGGFSGAAQVADLDLDGSPEVIWGPSAYDRDGNSLWHWRSGIGNHDVGFPALLSRNGGTHESQFRANERFVNPWTAIANVDADPFPELIALSGFTDASMWIIEHDGQIVRDPITLHRNVSGEDNFTISPPTIADFDGDGMPEIAITTIVNPPAAEESFDNPRKSFLTVYEPDGSRNWQMDLAPEPVLSRTFAPPAAAFDFDGDGASEIVMLVEQKSLILDGRDGEILWQQAVMNTLRNSVPYHHPVIADVDNDGGAEIVVPTSGQFAAGAAPHFGVMVLGDANDNWVHARSLWNQWQYNVTNVDADTSIPAEPRPSWQVHNSHREQVAVEGVDIFAAPDLSVSKVSIDAHSCPNDALITARVGNGGDIHAPADLAVRFYLGDPNAGGTLIGTAPTQNALFPGQFEDVSLVWDTPVAGQIFVTVNETQRRVATPSANLSLLPHTWAERHQFTFHSNVVNVDAWRAIDGDPNSGWAESPPSQERYADPRGKFFTVQFPFPVHATSVTVGNQRHITQDFGFLEGTLDFSNGFSTPFTLDANGEGTVTFPEQADIEWIRMTATVAKTNGTSISEFLVGGSYAQPQSLLREGGAGLINNQASLSLSQPPCSTVSPTPVIEAGPDQTVIEGDTDSFAVTVLDSIFQQDPVDVIPSDPTVSLVNLTGPVSVASGERAAFDIRITGKDTAHAFDVLFVQPATGRNLGSIPVTVNNVYAYSVRALDPDDDPITFRLAQSPAGAVIDPASGIIAWNPDTAGTYQFVVEAADDRGGRTTQSYQVLVTAGQPNQQPIITSSPPATAVVERDFSATVTADDPDGDPLSYFLTQAPAGLAIDTVTGVLSWTPDESQLGMHPVTVSVRDGRGGIATQAFDLEVTPDTANADPVIASTPLETAGAGKLYRYDVIASDADGDRLRFDAPLRPGGMVVDSGTGVVTWVPGGGQFGTHDVILRVRDGHGGVELQAYRITVREANALPVIVSQPPLQGVVGLPYAYPVIAQDTSGDTLTFRLDSSPLGMTIDPGTGVIQWTPSSGQIAGHPVEVTVADDRGGEASQVFDVTVVASAPNDPPVIRSIPRTDIHLGQSYFYQVHADDPNGDPLTYSLVTAPTGMSIDAGGLVRWPTDPSQFGSNNIEILVDDGRGGSDTQSFTVDVLQGVHNRPPLILSLPPTGAVVDRLLGYDILTTDPDGDPIAYALVRAPRGMSLHPGLGTLRWQPTLDQAGGQDVTVRAIDAQGGVANQSFRITVRTTNTPPVITSSPRTDAAADVLFSYDVTATDRDGDTLDYSLSQAPDRMTIDPVIGRIDWTPDSTQIGNHDMIIEVSDRNGGIASQQYTVIVSDVPANGPPAITSTPAVVGVTQSPYAYTVTADDPEGQTVDYLLRSRPTGMLINQSTGEVTWTPEIAQVGLHVVEIAARDMDGAAAIQRFTIDVADGNVAPVITSTPVTTVMAGERYRYDVQVADANGDPVALSLEAAPAGLSMDFLGRIEWSPQVGDGGTHTVTIRAEDDRGFFTIQTFDLTVELETQAPLVQLTVTPSTLPLGGHVRFLVEAVDNVGVTSLNLTLDGTPIPLDSNGSAIVAVHDVGALDVVATATDAAGNIGTATDTVFVTDPSVTGAPTAVIATPADGDTVTSPTEVIGSVDDPDLLLYTLEAGAVDGLFTEIGRGNTSVTDAVLGQFDPTLLPNDTYVLRLTATDSGGNTTVVEHEVGVEGDLKIGNFTLNFVDLAIPVSGIPIQVFRTYDTLHANEQGDFGFGWKLSFGDVRLRTSIPRTGLEQDLIYNHARIGDKIYVTRPDGVREGYTISIKQPLNIPEAFLQLVTPGFVPDPGVTSTLDVTNPCDVFVSRQNPRFIQRGDTLFCYGTSVPWHPLSPVSGDGALTLTTRGGIQYRIDGTNGELETATDRNGNTLTFSRTGITSDSGKEVIFERDPRGRISAIVDPMGNRVTYNYDSAGDLTAVTDREHHATQFVYRTDRPHYLDEVMDPLGRMGARTDYDATGRLASLTREGGATVRYVHDLSASSETVLDSLGNPTTYEYDARGNVIREVTPLGGVFDRTYDALDRLLSESDPLGRTVQMTYDDRGNLLSQTSPLGEVRQYTYSADAELTTATDPLGHTEHWDYDVPGNLIAYKDAAGHVTRYQYDGRGNNTVITDPGGNSTLFEYDNAGRLVREIDALGRTVVFSFDANGNQLGESRSVTTTSGPRDVITIRRYDANGNVLSVTDPEGGTTEYEYDAAGDHVATIDAQGRRFETAYDADGRPISTELPNGQVQTTKYDLEGRVTAVTDPNGVSTRYVYDPFGNLIGTIYADGTPGDITDNPQTQIAYDGAGLATAVVDEAGSRWEFAYDSAGQNIELSDPSGSSLVTAYDAAGREVAQTDATGRTTHFMRDELGRVVATRFADGSTTETAYDENGRIISTTDQLGRTTQFEYDRVGNLTAVVDAAGSRTEYSYDEINRLVSTIDANAHQTRFEYDRNGNRTAVVRPGGERSVNEFDLSGNLIRTITFNGDELTYEYDAAGRMTARHIAGRDSVFLTYTGAGLVETIQDARGQTEYKYDERNRLVSRTDPDGVAVLYEHTDGGNVSRITTPWTSTSYEYDTLGRMTSASDVSGQITQYSYDANGNLAQAQLANGVSVNYRYDNLNRLSFVENVAPDGTVLSSYLYTRDLAGNVEAVAEGSGRVVEYTYDDLNRLLQESIFDTGSGGPSRTIVYSYDEVGNRLTRDDSTSGLTIYSYDEKDQLTAETTDNVVTSYSYDKNGNVILRRAPTGSVRYVWTADNRLKETDLDGDGTADRTYEYDLDGNRVASVAGSEETRYLLDTSRTVSDVLVEYAAGVPEASYVRGVGLIAQDRGLARSYYLHDGQGNVRQLADAAGNVTDAMSYDAFGRLVHASGLTENAYQFEGEWFDNELNWVYLRARYYDPQLGRFTTVDPFEGVPDVPMSLHRYLYANANPVSFEDPTGLFSVLEVLQSTGIQSVLASIAAINFVSFLQLGLGRFLGGATVSWKATVTQFGFEAASGRRLGPSFGTASFLPDSQCIDLFDGSSTQSFRYVGSKYTFALIGVSLGGPGPSYSIGETTMRSYANSSFAWQTFTGAVNLYGASAGGYFTHPLLELSPLGVPNNGIGLSVLAAGFGVGIDLSGFFGVDTSVGLSSGFSIPIGIGHWERCP